MSSQKWKTLPYACHLQHEREVQRPMAKIRSTNRHAMQSTQTGSLKRGESQNQDSASGTYAHNWHDRAKRKLKLQLRPCKKRLISLHCPTPGGMRTDTLQRRHCRSVKASGGRAPPFCAPPWEQAASILQTLAPNGNCIICSDTVQCQQPRHR